MNPRRLNVAAITGRLPLILFLSLLLLPHPTHSSPTAPLDTNANGMSDIFERHYNQGELFNPANPAHHPDSDPDGDGWTNLQESVAGTDPFSGKPPEGLVVCYITYLANQEEAPTPEFPDGRLIDLAILSWDSLPGKQYTLLFSADLQAGNWTAVDTPHTGDDDPIAAPVSSMNAGLAQTNTGDGNPIAVPVLLTDNDGHSPERLFWRVQINDLDSDNDGLTDHEEIMLGSNPYAADTSGGGIPDKWVATHLAHIPGIFQNLNPHAILAGSDGTILEAYLSGADPTQPFGDELPSWTVANSGETTAEDDPAPPVIRTRTVTLPAGSSALVLVIISSREFDYFTDPENNQLEFNDILTWSLDLSHASELSGEINVNDRHQLWLAARNAEQTLSGFMNTVHYEHAGILQAPPDEPLEIEITLSAVNVTDNWLASEIAVGILPIHIELDITNTGEIDSPLDDFSAYLPGYLDDQPVLDTESAFSDLAYAGPQAMNLIISGEALEFADSVHITFGDNVTAYPGWCGNSGDDESDDFSFAAGEDQRETTKAIEDGRAVIPIFCKDYAAWADMEITLLKEEEPIHEGAIGRTLPEDTNGDRIADRWQRGEVLRWNLQFGFQHGNPEWIDSGDPDIWEPLFGTNGEADAELAKSMGPNGNSPAMADDGDGLTALQEYRGYFLDGGPGIYTPRHKRLSVSRKDLLVECSEMEHIASVDGIFNNDPLRPGESDPGNQANALAQNYTLDAVMNRVSEFYRDAARGGVIDLYWVRDPLDDLEPLVEYSDSSLRRAYKHIGTYKYLKQDGTIVNENSWLTIENDLKLRVEFRQRWEELYRPEEQNGIGIAANTRNPRCEDFVKFLLAGRKGTMGADGILRKTSIPEYGGGTAYAADDNTTTVIAAQAAILYVNSLSECRVFASAEEFIDTLAYASAHEIGHLIIRPGNGLSSNEHRVGNPPSLMGSGPLLSPLVLHEDEIKNINLRLRSGILP